MLSNQKSNLVYCNVNNAAVKHRSFEYEHTNFDNVEYENMVLKLSTSIRIYFNISKVINFCIDKEM